MREAGCLSQRSGARRTSYFHARAFPQVLMRGSIVRALGLADILSVVAMRPPDPSNLGLSTDRPPGCNLDESLKINEMCGRK